MSGPVFVAGAPEPVVDALVLGFAELLDEPVSKVAGENGLDGHAAAFPGARFVFVGDASGAPRGAHTVDPQLLVAGDASGELRRLCDALGVRYDQALLTALEHVQRGPDAGAAAFRSVSTNTFGQRLEALGSSLLVSTYQTNRLVCARVREGQLNTHLRGFDKPMGMAVTRDGRLALGTRSEVWDFRNMPAVAAKLDPPGSHDACFLPRNRHVTGDIAVHELAFAAGALWGVATAFSCLVTFDADNSFVPRWKPPWISALSTGDRCHLNGMAVRDGVVRYATALGTGDEPGSWRAGKASGGVLIDVPSSEVIASGLSMPHSPRWHDGRLWVLESGRGTLAAVDPSTGAVETVVELPGFTRGLTFAGGTAFVGLSQIRETSTFGDLPLVDRLDERLCGVWTVDLTTGTVEGFLRFDDLVQEIFDIALLSGVRWPEVAEPGDAVVASSYALP